MGRPLPSRPKPKPRQPPPIPPPIPRATNGDEVVNVGDVAKIDATTKAPSPRRPSPRVSSAREQADDEEEAAVDERELPVPGDGSASALDQLASVIGEPYDAQHYIDDDDETTDNETTDDDKTTDDDEASEVSAVSEVVEGQLVVVDAVEETSTVVEEQDSGVVSSSDRVLKDAKKKEADMDESTRLAEEAEELVKKEKIEIEVEIFILAGFGLKPKDKKWGKKSCDAHVVVSTLSQDGIETLVGKTKSNNSLDPVWEDEKIKAVVPYTEATLGFKVRLDVCDHGRVLGEVFLDRALMLERHNPESFVLALRPPAGAAYREDGYYGCVELKLQLAGRVVLYVAGARHLLAADGCGTSDPYATVQWKGHKARKVGRTKTIKKTLSPKWNAAFILSVPLLRTDHGGSVQIDLWDDDWLGADDFLGRLTLEAEWLLRQRTMDAVTIPLKPRKAQEKVQGSVIVSVAVPVAIFDLATRLTSLAGQQKTTNTIPRCHVRVKILRASRLKLADCFGYRPGDPYAVLYMDGRKVGKTPTRPKTTKPIWEKANLFVLHDIPTTTAKKIMDQPRWQSSLDDRRSGKKGLKKQQNCAKKPVKKKKKKEEAPSSSSSSSAELFDDGKNQEGGAPSSAEENDGDSEVGKKLNMQVKEEEEEDDEDTFEVNSDVSSSDDDSDEEEEEERGQKSGEDECSLKEDDASSRRQPVLPAEEDFDIEEEMANSRPASGGGPPGGKTPQVDVHIDLFDDDLLSRAFLGRARLTWRQLMTAGPLELDLEERVAGKKEQVSGTLTLLISQEAIVQGRVCEAVGLAQADSWDVSGDPYVAVKWGNKRLCKTKVRDNCLDPLWFHTYFSLTIPLNPEPYEDPPEELVVQVWEKNVITADSFMGATFLTKEQLLHPSPALPHDLVRRPGNSEDPPPQGTLLLELQTSYIPFKILEPAKAERMRFRPLKTANAQGPHVQVKLKILRAGNLLMMDLFGGADPFVIVRRAGHVVGRTATKNNSRSPIWRDEHVFLSFELNDDGLLTDSTAQIDLEVWDADSFGKELMGIARLGHHELFSAGLCRYALAPKKPSKAFCDDPEHVDPGLGWIEICCELYSSLTLQVDKADDLRAADASGTSDPYCKASWLGPNERGLGKSEVEKRTLSPRWGYQVALSVPLCPPMNQFASILLEVWDHDDHPTGIFKKSVEKTESDFLGLSVIDPHELIAAAVDGTTQTRRLMSRSKASEKGCQGTITWRVLLSKPVRRLRKRLAAELAESKTKNHLDGVTVKFEILKCVDLRANLGDPYFKAYCQGQMLGKTSIVKNTRQPKWPGDGSQAFTVKNVPTRFNESREAKSDFEDSFSIRLACFDYESVGADEALGECKLSWADLMSEQVLEVELRGFVLDAARAGKKATLSKEIMESYAQRMGLTKVGDNGTTIEEQQLAKDREARDTAKEIEKLKQRRNVSRKGATARTLKRVYPKVYIRVWHVARVRISIVGALGLRAADVDMMTTMGHQQSKGKSDPYCIVRYLGKRIAKTKISKKTLDPVWNQIVELELETYTGLSGVGNSTEVQIQVWDHDLLGSDDLLGTCSLSRGELLRPHRADIFELGPQPNAKPGHPKPSGYLEMYIEASYIPRSMEPVEWPRGSTTDLDQALMNYKVGKKNDDTAVDNEWATRDIRSAVDETSGRLFWYDRKSKERWWADPRPLPEFPERVFSFPPPPPRASQAKRLYAEINEPGPTDAGYVFKPCATVEVVVVRAKNLRRADLNRGLSMSSKSDPYAVVRYGTKITRETVGRTRTRSNTLDPVWGDGEPPIRFPCLLDASCAAQDLLIELWDYDGLLGSSALTGGKNSSSDDGLGQCLITPAEYLNATGPIRKPLSPQPGEPAVTGWIEVRVNILGRVRVLVDDFSTSASSSTPEDDEELECAATWRGWHEAELGRTKLVVKAQKTAQIVVDVPLQRPGGHLSLAIFKSKREHGGTRHRGSLKILQANNQILVGEFVLTTAQLLNPTQKAPQTLLLKGGAGGARGGKRTLSVRVECPDAVSRLARCVRSARELQATANILPSLDSLEIRVLRAFNLQVMDRSCLSDPFVVVWHRGVKIGQTAVKKRTLNPAWDNESFQLENFRTVQDVKHAEAGGLRDFERSRRGVLFEVFDSDGPGSKPDFLGAALMRHEDLLRAGEHDLELREQDAMEVDAVMAKTGGTEKKKKRRRCQQLAVGLCKPCNSVGGALATARDVVHTLAEIGCPFIFGCCPRPPPVRGRLYLRVRHRARVELRICEAFMLKAMDTKTSDPYCIVEYRGKQLAQTKVRSATLEPCWYESLVLSLDVPLPHEGDPGLDLRWDHPGRAFQRATSEALSITVWDRDALSRDDFIGEVVLRPEVLLKPQNGTLWPLLTKESNGLSEETLMMMTMMMGQSSSSSSEKFLGYLDIRIETTRVPGSLDPLDRRQHGAAGRYVETTTEMGRSYFYDVWTKETFWQSPESVAQTERQHYLKNRRHQQEEEEEEEEKQMIREQQPRNNNMRRKSSLVATLFGGPPPSEKQKEGGPPEESGRRSFPMGPGIFGSEQKEPGEERQSWPRRKSGFKGLLPSGGEKEEEEEGPPPPHLKKRKGPSIDFKGHHHHSSSEKLEEEPPEEIIPLVVDSGGLPRVANLLTEETAEPQLVVKMTIVRATNLDRVDRFGGGDPYCVVKCAGSLVGETTVKKKTLNPEWFESVAFATPLPTADDDVEIGFEVWDYDAVGADDLMGLCFLRTSRLSGDPGSEPFFEGGLKLEGRAGMRPVGGVLTVHAELYLLTGIEIKRAFRDTLTTTVDDTTSGRRNMEEKQQQLFESLYCSLRWTGKDAGRESRTATSFDPQRPNWGASSPERRLLFAPLRFPPEVLQVELREHRRSVKDHFVGRLHLDTSELSGEERRDRVHSDRRYLLQPEKLTRLRDPKDDPTTLPETSYLLLHEHERQLSRAIGGTGGGGTHHEKYANPLLLLPHTGDNTEMAAGSETAPPPPHHHPPDATHIPSEGAKLEAPLASPHMSPALLRRKISRVPANHHREVEEPPVLETFEVPEKKKKRLCGLCGSEAFRRRKEAEVVEELEEPAAAKRPTRRTRVKRTTKLVINAEGDEEEVEHVETPEDVLTVKMLVPDRVSAFYKTARTSWRQQPSQNTLPLIQAEIEILKADGLRKKDYLTGSSDPYVIVTAGGVVVGKTKTAHRTLNPKWAGAHFELPAFPGAPKTAHAAFSSRVELRVMHDGLLENFLGYHVLEHADLLDEVGKWRTITLVANPEVADAPRVIDGDYTPPPPRQKQELSAATGKKNTSFGTLTVKVALVSLVSIRVLTGFFAGSDKKHKKKRKLKIHYLGEPLGATKASSDACWYETFHLKVPVPTEELYGEPCYIEAWEGAEHGGEKLVGVVEIAHEELLFPHDWPGTRFFYAEALDIEAHRTQRREDPRVFVEKRDVKGQLELCVAASRVPSLLEPRRRSTEAACYSEAVDPRTQEAYWYDVCTKERFWEDPRPAAEALVQRFFKEHEASRSLKGDMNNRDNNNSNTINNMPLDLVRAKAGFPDPPTAVACAGADNRSHVWWTAPRQNGGPRVTGYTVQRQRKGGTRDQRGPGAEEQEAGWLDKGSVYVEEHAHCLLTELANGAFYRFRVTSHNALGKSAASRWSNVVLVSRPLPEGWIEIAGSAASGNAIYYHNVKTRQTTWARPETDPFYLPTQLFLSFSRFEMDQLQKLFMEKDFDRSNAISLREFEACLPELGERLATQDVLWLFYQADLDPSAELTFAQFAKCVDTLKSARIDRAPLIRKALASLSERWDYLTRPRVGGTGRALLTNKSKEISQRFPAWAKEEHPDLDGECYWVNKETGDASYKTPQEIKFFIPDALLAEASSLLEQEKLHDLEDQFEMMDIDSSGTIDAQELKLLMGSIFGGVVSDGRCRGLIREVDADGSGTIDFGEFVLIVVTMKKGRAGHTWSQIGDKIGDKNLAKDLQDAKDNRAERMLQQRRGGQRRPHGYYCVCGCRALLKTEDQDDERPKKPIFPKLSTAQLRRQARAGGTAASKALEEIVTTVVDDTAPFVAKQERAPKKQEPPPQWSMLLSQHHRDFQKKTRKYGELDMEE